MKKIGMIFDLDQTLIDSSKAEPFRKPNSWQLAYDQIPHFLTYKGVIEALDYLAFNKIPYCIVTSSPSNYCSRVCDFWNIQRNHMVCYHDTPYNEKKPHPSPILLALSKLEIEPQNALSFGDRDIDIIASNKAGVKSVACLWGAADNFSLQNSNPSYILNNATEIIPLIQQLLQN